MYSLNRKIEHVKSFNSISNLYISGDEVLDILSQSFISKVGNASYIFNLTASDNIILDDNNNPYLIKDKQLSTSYFTDFRISFVKFPWIGFYKKGVNKLNGIFDYKNQKITFETKDWIGRDIFSDFIFSDFHNIVTCRSLPDCTVLWEFDITQIKERENKPCEFEKFIGVWENQFLFSCKNNTVLSIHIETGELIHQWYDMPPIVYLSVEYNTIQDSRCITLDEKRGELVGLHSFMYLKIDLKTKEITSRCLDDILAKNNLNLLNDLSKCLITDTHYITTGETPWVAGLHRGTEVLLAMNKDTLEIDWKFHFDEDVWLSNNQPEIGSDKLYQLDTDGNLYVFQKE